MKREVEALQRTIQEKSGEIQHLQKRLADLERDKHTEVVKLRLEVNKLYTLPCQLRAEFQSKQLYTIYVHSAV